MWPRFAGGVGADLPAAAAERFPSWTVIAALAPAAAVGVFYFGARALLLLAGCTAGCTAFEALLRRLPGGAPAVSGRGALTGLLLGMCLPPASPAWLALAGCAVATLAGRMTFGTLGFNPVNPVLVARVVLTTAFPIPMTTWSEPGGIFVGASAVAVAPATFGTGSVNLLDGLIGRIPGGAGETSVVALGLGGVFLLWRGATAWQIPVSFLGGVAALAAVLNALAPERFPGPGVHLVTGGLVFAALFLAADPRTAPTTARGRLIFGAGCGVLVWVLRTFGDHPAGVPWAILLMNALTPLIDLYSGSRGAEEGETGG